MTKSVVDLSETDRQRIAALVEAGFYPDATALLREGLRLIEQQALNRSARISALQDSHVSAGPARRHVLVAEFEEGPQASFT